MRLALRRATPVYGLYPPLVTAMLVGGCAALMCYLSTMLSVLVFYVLFGTDIRMRHSPRRMGWGWGSWAGLVQHIGSYDR